MISASTNKEHYPLPCRLKAVFRYEVVNEEKSFEKSLIKVLQDLSPGITLMMRPFRLFPFYYPYTVRLYRKHARSEVLIIPRDDSLYIPCH